MVGTREPQTASGSEKASILGCVRENLGIPDGNIDVNPVNVKKLITVIRKYRPRMLIIPHWHERHPDHIHTHHLCREAWFYAGLRKIRTTLNGRTQEAWRPDSYIHYMQWYEFTPSFIVDITGVYDIRLQAIKAHSSQFYDPESTEPATKLSDVKFLEFVETRAKSYGSKIGVDYGEPFYSVESVGIADPLELTMVKG